MKAIYDKHNHDHIRNNIMPSKFLQEYNKRKAANRNVESLADQAKKWKAGMLEADRSLIKEMRKLEKNVEEVMSTKEDLTEMKALKLRHVITLKRWVFRTKRKLEVQTLADCERIAIQKYLKTCRKLCTLKSFNKQELKDVQKLKRIGEGSEIGTASTQKRAVYGALTLYLDFINLFLFLLRLIGGRD